jgi:hypothetical protein
VPDVLVARDPGAASFAGSSSHVAAATIDPITVPLAMREVEIRERWIEIKRLPELDPVTVIEILSPSNKPGEGREQYLEKRAAVIEGEIHLVEIDLLLGGRPTPLGKPLPPHHYRAQIARAERRPDAELYGWTIRHPLPNLPIPLRAPDADVMLPLDEAFEQTYRLGRFDRLVRHGTPLPEGIRLGPEDRQWAEALGTR